MDNKNSFEFIHIGKCGGSTVTKYFMDNKITFNQNHMKKINYDIRKKYIILIRNPISRFISAFNWRYKLVCIDKIQKTRFPNEKKVFEKYKDVNLFAENIYSKTEEFDIFKKENIYIHHIKEDIDFYIGDFLHDCNPKNIICVLCNETLNDDLKKYFGIQNTMYIKQNKSEFYNKTLSELAYSNLKKYLQKDYECIDKLFKLGVITKEKYEILSK